MIVDVEVGDITAPQKNPDIIIGMKAPVSDLTSI